MINIKIKFHVKAPDITLSLKESLELLDNPNDFMLNLQLDYRENNTCIYLDKVYKKDRSYLFEGEINGRLLNNGKDGFIKYKLEFKNVISMFTCELDSYDAINTNSVYSFEIVEDSKYLKIIAANDELDIKSLKHYRLKTYDEVFEIITEDYSLEIK